MRLRRFFDQRGDRGEFVVLIRPSALTEIGEDIAAAVRLLADQLSVLSQLGTVLQFAYWSF